jgi:hypothetical protein
MPLAGFEPIVSASKQSRPTPQTARPLGPAKMDLVNTVTYWVSLVVLHM